MRATRGLLLAAGRGTRLRPLTDVVAKPAVPILDVPLGAWGLTALVARDLPVTVNVSHLEDTVISSLGALGIPFHVFVEKPDPLGTGGTLRALREGVSERLITWNSDLVAGVDLAALEDHHVRSGDAATLAMTPVDHAADFELRDGRPVRLIDRRRENASGARFVGVAVYDRTALDILGNQEPLGATEGLLAPLLRRGTLGAFEHRGYARDAGTLDRYLRVSLDLLEGSAPAPRGGFPGEILEVPGGRAYVGPGARAEPKGIASGAVLLAGCIVGEDATITDSIVWPGERVPAGTVLENCVWFGGRALPVLG